MQLRARVFDFDGLILDTENPVHASWAAVYEAHGAVLDLALWQSIIGTDGFDPVSDLERRVGRRLDWGAIDPGRRRHRDVLQAAEAIRPGVIEWLDEAAALGLPVGIASSSPSDWVRGHLDRIGLLDRFEPVRCRDDVGAAKPDPAAYVAVLEALGVNGREALALEDSPHGVAAAKAAGMWCVAVPNSLTVGLDFAAADLVLASLADATIAGVVEQLSVDRTAG